MERIDIKDPHDCCGCRACAENHQLTFPAKPHRNRDKFFRLRSRGIAFCDNVNICKKPDNFVQKVARKINLVFKHDK